MNCKKIMDMVYEYDDSMPVLVNLYIRLHSIFCSDCAVEIERYHSARLFLHEDFIPPSPGLEVSIMAKIQDEELPVPEDVFAAPGSLSTRNWVFASLFILVSLVTAFFGLEYQQLAIEGGISFILPMGITIGIGLTVFGAFFIAGNLEKFSERFGL